MTVSPANLSAALAVLGNPEQAVPAETVWAQTSVFYPHWWRKRWPQHLALPEFLKRPEAQLSVSRKRLFELADGIETEADALSFYVAVCAWGAGPYAQQVARSMKPLVQPDAPAKLLAGFKVAATSTATESYAAFHGAGPAKIKGLGPAFFSKLMYFAAGQPSPLATRHPLILDKRVAQALGWKKTADWSTSEYSAYLDLIEALHQQWRPDLPTDVIEYTLFQGPAAALPPSI